MDRRRRSVRLDSLAEPMTKVVRRREKPRERWLLTRKTWKYMTDAGRRLIPDGTQNRIEDVPRIEAYFQEVCAKEPKFLLWRKSSYPGAIPRPRRKKRVRGGSVRARSPSDDTPVVPTRPTDLLIGHTSGGRLDLNKLRRDFFAAPPPVINTVIPNIEPEPEEDDDSCLVDLLRKYLKLEEDSGPTRRSGCDELVKTLRKFLSKQAEKDEAARRIGTREVENDTTQRTLLETLGRYYGRSSNRDNIVQDLLTDRNLLKRLYHDLRKTKPYRGGRGGGAGSYTPGVYNSTYRSTLHSRPTSLLRNYNGDGYSRTDPPLSPPPLIEVPGESLEDKLVDCGTQTMPIPEEVLLELEKVYRDKIEIATAPTSPTGPCPDRRTARRRSSVDHDDVSQSVSDTIKRYLRMARKKSVDADKADRFKRINYDKNLRNIKPKTPGEIDDDGPNKGCQTEEGWIMTYRDLKFATESTSPTSPLTSPPSPASPSQSHSFLSTLLGRSGPTVCPTTGDMQRSRSSSSVIHSVGKRLWPTRSRSSSRVAATWTPQGSCAWADGSGRSVRLGACSLLTLSEVERRAVQQAALARLHQLKLGSTIKIPEEHAAVNAKPKRRTYLLKRKALTTGFFDQSRAKDGDKDKENNGSGSVFGVPLAQCVETERAQRRLQHGGSRASLASIGGIERGDDSESCDSGDWGWAGLEEAGGGGPRVPGLVSACLAHLRRHGLHTLGLFRVSASKKRVRQLREKWERGQEAALDAAVCPHDIATLLKDFLRDLPDPLLCKDLYAAFLQTQKIRNRRSQWEALMLLVQILPAAHRDTLNALLSFLSQLAAHAQDDRQPGNKMDAANLATVFAPNILHKNKPNEVASAELLSERTDVINVVRLLIERQAELWTLPADLLHEAYLHLAHSAPAHLDSLLLRRAECASERLSSGAGEDTDGDGRRMWSREEFLHGAAATGGPDRDVPLRRSEKSYSRMRRTRETASDTSSGSLSSAMTIVTRVRSSMEECGSSGVVCSGPVSEPPSATPSATSARTDSAPDSADSASDYNETLGGSDDDSCVITASLHIPAAFPREVPSPRRPSAPPRRRSTSGSDSSAKRDSAVGSSSPASASNASSPPSSPPPAALRVTLTSTGELRRPVDIDRLISLGRERNTSDARAVVLRQHDDNSSHQSTVRNRENKALARHREERSNVRTPEQRHREDLSRHEAATTLYKRGELISSARAAPP